jgi:serine/threonine protein phosphatase PrpC
LLILAIAASIYCARVILRQTTQDRNQASELQREGVLSPEDALRSPLRHVLSRSLGTIRTVEPQIDSCDWQDGDRLLLCTDGLHADLAHELIASVLTEEHGRRILANTSWPRHWGWTKPTKTISLYLSCLYLPTTTYLYIDYSPIAKRGSLV